MNVCMFSLYLLYQILDGDFFIHSVKKCVHLLYILIHVPKMMTFVRMKASRMSHWEMCLLPVSRTRESPSLATVTR